MNISERIISIMNQRNINKKMLADRLGIPPQNINSTVLNNPKFEVLERVAVALDMSLPELVGGEKQEPKQTMPFILCPYCGRRIILNTQKDETSHGV